jgi:hypothetical protein
MSENVTNISGYTFTSEKLIYNQTYYWYFWITDRAGNSIQTQLYNFTVADFTPPSCTFITQDTSSPAYDENNNISTHIFEPTDASGVDTILFYYRIDNQSWQYNSTTETQFYTFNASVLSYGQVWEWYFWFNDTVGNQERTRTQNFSVQDFLPPDYAEVHQTNEVIYPGENNTVSLKAFEPIDASGIESIYVYYSQNMVSWSFFEITAVQKFCFEANSLQDGIYYWYFGLFDEAENSIETPIQSFEVVITTINLSPIVPLGILSSLLLGTFALVLIYKRRK